MNTAELIPLMDVNGAIAFGWQDLLNHLDLNFSLSPGWSKVCAESIGLGRGEFYVYVEASSSSDIHGVLPFYIEQQRFLGLPLRVLKPVANLVSYHAELITLDDPAAFLARFLQAAPRWDVLHLANIMANGRTAKGIEALVHARKLPVQVIPGDASPYLPVEGAWEEFLASRNKKFRYKIKKRNQLVRDGQAEVLWFTDRNSVDQLLEKMLRIESKSWKTAARIDITSNVIERRYHANLLPYLAEHEALLANVVCFDDVPVAYSLCCHFNGWIGHLKTSFDEEYAHASPGALAVDASVEAAFRLGAHEFDFLGDAAPQKLHWSKSIRQHIDCFIFAERRVPRLIGRLKGLRSSGRRALEPYGAPQP